jgi:uncharacterized protein (TIGR02145 family)
MRTIILQKRAFLVAMAAAVVVVLCCGCSDNGIGGAFVIARNGGNNDCGKDGTAGSCKTVKIGNQTWMAENLNYTPSSGNSWCYDDKESNCNIYGRLYDWSTAMGIDASYNSTAWGGRNDEKYKGICPEGWHLPSQAEWDTLVTYVGGSAVAGKKLKSTYGWVNGGDGTDNHGVSALPGGRYSNGNFYNAGNTGYWWTATEIGSNSAYSRGMSYSNDYVNEYGYGNGKSYGLSVRCVKE